MDMESPRRGQGLERQGADGAQLPQQGRAASDARRGAGGSQGAAVPPPMPAYDPAPGGVTGLADWLRAPRPEAAPGIWRHGYAPLPPRDPERTPTRQLLGGAVVSFLIGWLLWSLLYNGYLGPYWLWPLKVLPPAGTWEELGDFLALLYYGLVLAILAVVFGRMGHWWELARRALEAVRKRDPRGAGNVHRSTRVSSTPAPDQDPVEWPELRAQGAAQVADRLAAEARGGRMNDVDHARIRRAWESVRARPSRLSAFLDSVQTDGAAACRHRSGQRDLPRPRTAPHDLSLGQVRIGTAPDNDRNPDPYRGAGLALEPALLGTSALAVGPPGSGKTTRLARPVTESLCLQALAQQAAVVAVTAHGERLGEDEQFDVVVRLGDPASRYDLDPYGGTADPDEAAAILAEALVGDLAEDLPGGDSARSATVLAQLIGPYRAAHCRFPSVPELRELLDATAGGGPAAGALGALRDRLETAGHGAQLRELDACIRQSGRAGDASALLADRIALLDRPAFEGFLAPEGATDGTGAKAVEGTRRPFSLRALEMPVRVRVDLPERGHAEASRILARLVLAQFTACVTAREDRSLFAGLVLDDASRTVTPQSLRGLQQLRSANGGVLLTLRGLDDVPQRLQAPLLGAVGCRMVCAGVTPWDAERFAEVWGTEWVETRDVTNRQLVSDEPFTKMMHAVRRLATGRHVTAESVTVRQVRRERWSASELANELPAGHAVLSLSTVGGERTPPILARLEA